MGADPCGSCRCFIKFMQYPKCFVVVSPVFTTPFLGVEFISRNHVLCSSIRSNSSSFNSYPETAAIHSCCQVPRLILVLLLIPAHLQFLPSLKPKTPQCHPGQLEETPLPNSYFCCSFDLFSLITNVLYGI